MREYLRRIVRRVIHWALDGPPALRADLVDVKDVIDDAVGSLDSRLDYLEFRQRRLEKSVGLAPIGEEAI